MGLCKGADPPDYFTSPPPLPPAPPPSPPPPPAVMCKCNTPNCGTAYKNGYYCVGHTGYSFCEAHESCTAEEWTPLGEICKDCSGCSLDYSGCAALTPKSKCYGCCYCS